MRIPRLPTSAQRAKACGAALSVANPESGIGKFFHVRRAKNPAASGARGARNALAAMSEGDTLRTLLAALRRLLKPVPINTVARRRQIADVIIDRKAYPYM